MIEIKSDEEKIISFDMQVEGTGELPKVRLIIEQVNQKFDISVPCTYEHGVVEVRIPKFDELMPDISETKRLRARVEAIVEDTIGVPWEDEIHVEPTIKIKATQTNIRTESKKPKIQAVIKEVKTLKTKPLKEQDSRDLQKDIQKVSDKEKQEKKKEKEQDAKQAKRDAKMADQVAKKVSKTMAERFEEA